MWVWKNHANSVLCSNYAFSDAVHGAFDRRFRHLLELHCPSLRIAVTSLATKLAEVLQIFKRYLDELLVPLFRSLTCENQLCRAAAGRCVGAIRDCIGPGILAGRITQEQRASMEGSQDVPPLAGEFGTQN